MRPAVARTGRRGPSGQVRAGEKVFCKAPQSYGKWRCPLIPAIEAKFINLRTEVERATFEDLPRMAGLLAEAEGALALRLKQGQPQADPGGTTRPEPERWITVERAAEIASVDRKTLYGWLRGKKWVSRPTRRSLRIAETEFRNWMANR